MRSSLENFNIQRAVANQLQQNADNYIEDYAMNVIQFYSNINNDIVVLNTPFKTKIVVDDVYYLGDIFKIILSETPEQIKVEINTNDGVIEAKLNETDLTLFDLADILLTQWDETL